MQSKKWKHLEIEYYFTFRKVWIISEIFLILSHTESKKWMEHHKRVSVPQISRITDKEIPRNQMENNLKRKIKKTPGFKLQRVKRTKTWSISWRCKMNREETAIISLKSYYNPWYLSERSPNRSTCTVFIAFRSDGSRKKTVFRTCFLPFVFVWV